MNQKSNHKPAKPILGYGDTNTVMLDFDNLSFKKVKAVAFKILKLFQSKAKIRRWSPQHKLHLEGFIILRSRKNHYHVVFNKTVSWLENLNVIAWTCLYSHSRSSQDWFVMQCVKGSSTLRIGKKGLKPCPRIVFRYGKLDGEIQNYLKWKRNIQRWERNLHEESLCRS